jgi:hypothetical protein
VFDGYDIYVFGDNINEETEEFIAPYVINQKVKFQKLNGLGNAKSFLYIIQFAIDNFDRDELVYLVEDDYLHLNGAPLALGEAINLQADYLTLYDHPDKYSSEYNYGMDSVRVVPTSNFHWKQTISTTMTFATTPAVLKRDIEIWTRAANSNPPTDHQAFLELRQQERTLFSCIPGQSTHTEALFLSPISNWFEVINAKA